MKKALLIAIIMYIISFLIPFMAVKSPPPVTDKKNTITLYDTKTKKTTEIPFEEYLLYVVAAEMPASFHEEAIKAQCICTRTYSIKKSEAVSHPDGAMLCTDINHCQAYTNNEELEKKWKGNYKYYKNKIQSALRETENMIITYNNEPIDAIYHSSNNGYTENADDVWSNPLPYLKSVKSPDENSPDFNYTYHISADDLYSKIKAEFPDAQPDFSIGEITYTQGGNVDSINLCSVDIKGTVLRKILNLKSASFDIKKTDNAFEITTHGYGHGAGLSQYGANKLAHDGKAYEEILMHYYKNTKISCLE